MLKSTAMIFGLSGYAAAEEAIGSKRTPITGNASFRHEAGSACGMGGALTEAAPRGKVLTRLRTSQAVQPCFWEAVSATRQRIDPAIAC